MHRIHAESNFMKSTLMIPLISLLAFFPSFLLADTKPLSLAEVQKEVNGLKKEDVAWRKIEWRTCLLDGLKASRKQKKPIMLWVFIDRPIDDERC